MPRQRRLFLEDTPCHVVQRGNNRTACFFNNEDLEFYRLCLLEASLEFGCKIHAYVFMTNHIHLLVTPETKQSIAKMMQSIGRRYVGYINKRYRRTGTLWEGRYKSSLVIGSEYTLTCYRYIELNPVKARMVQHPYQYRWSSYRSNGMGESDELITPHQTYEKCIGEERDLKRYHEIFEDGPYLEKSNMIGPLLEKNLPFCSAKFRSEIAKANGFRINRERVGRPEVRSS